MKQTHFFLGMLLAILSMNLIGCGQATLLTNVQAGDGQSAIVRPNGSGQAVTISYNVGKPATVSIYLLDAAGKRYTLRDQVEREPASTPYSLRFYGTVQGDDPNMLQQVLPNGSYRYIVSAQAKDGETREQGGTIEVQDAIAAVPMIEDLRVEPAIVTPNEDAQDDVATFVYRLPVTATVSIAINSPTETIPFITDLVEGPYEQSHIWDGKRADGSLLASGSYTFTVTARDQIGNVVRKSSQVRIESPGRSEAQITYFRLAPTEVEFGGVITATIKVKNTGTVPIRTQGPASGYTYSTNQLFSSIEEERWAAKGGGFWRVAVGYDGGPGYPFRWAISERPMSQWVEPDKSDVIYPGEEVTITGIIQIKERQEKLYFFAGLAHEGVGYPINRKGVTLVKIGF